MSGKLDMVNSSRYRIAAEQGANFTRRFTVKDTAGALLPLTAYTAAKLQVRMGTGGPSFSSGPWNPKSASVDAWFSAQGLPGSNGTEVALWADLSDQKNDFSTVGTKPVIDTAALAGYPVVNSQNAVLDSAFAINGPFTLAWLRKIDSYGSAGLTVQSKLDAITKNFRCALNADKATREWGFNGRVCKTSWVAPVDTGFHLDMVSFTTDYEVLARTDGSPVSTIAIDPGAGSADVTQLGFASGQVRTAELVFFNRALASGDMDILDGYLMNRWGLAGQLPATHPYKNKVPTGLVEDPPVLSISTDDYLSISQATSTISVEVPAAVTLALAPGMYYYDLKLFGPMTRTRLVEGKFEVTAQTSF